MLHYNLSTLASFVLETVADNRGCGQRTDQAHDITVPTKESRGTRLWAVSKWTGVGKAATAFIPYPIHGAVNLRRWSAERRVS